MVTLAERRHAAGYLQTRYAVSERRACRVLALPRNSKRAAPARAPGGEAVQALLALSQTEPRWGYRKVHDRLRLDGHRIGRERVRLVRAREGLQVRRRVHKRRYPGLGKPLLQAAWPNHVWTYDFVADATADGRRLKCLTVCDEFTRRGLRIEIARSLGAAEVKRVLALLFAVHARPAYLRSDNGPEFVAAALREWLATEHVSPHYIEPGSPWQNGYGESFNAIFRDECLNRWEFLSPREARLISERWLEKYNDYRPHGSLKGLPPNLFLEKWRQEQPSKKAA